MTDFYPGVSGDDGYGSTSGTFNNSGTTFQVGEYSAISPNDFLYGFCRLPNVNIPKGATILSAVFNFYVNSAPYNGADIRFFMELAPNPAAPTTKADLFGRTMTTNYVTGPSYYTSSGWKTSPDMKDVLQEVVNQGSYAAGNAMIVHPRGINSFANRGYVNVRSYDYGSELPYLTATWKAGGPQTRGVI